MDIFFSFHDSDMDLNEDITGSRAQNKGQSDCPPEPELSGIWNPNEHNGLSLMKYQELPGIPDNRFTSELLSLEKRGVIDKVYRMAMRDEPPLQMERTLKLSFTDLSSSQFLRFTLWVLPMIGKIFWECKAFRTENDAKRELSRRKGVKPIFVRRCERCKKCIHLNRQSNSCSILGLPVFDNNFELPPSPRIINHLKIANVISNSVQQMSWDDVRTAMVLPQPEQKRVYTNYGPTKVASQGALYRKGMRELNKIAIEKEAQTKRDKFSNFVIKTGNKLMRSIQECILKNRLIDASTDELIRKTILPEDNRDKCEQIIKQLRSDPLLWSGLRVLLPVYDTCDEIQKFWYKNHIHVPFAVVHNQCLSSCTNNINSKCWKYGFYLVNYSDEIPISNRIQIIDTIGSEKKLDHNQKEFCKALEENEYLSGLRKLREIVSCGTKIETYDGAGIQELSMLPQKTSEVNAAEWASSKLKANESTIRIETSLKRAIGDKMASSILQDAILLTRTYPTDRNDLCLTEYQIHHEAKIHRINRCKSCRNATSLICGKYGKNFSAEITEVPPEMNEMIGYYRDHQIQVEVDPKKKETPLEVNIENPGQLLTVDMNNIKDLDDKSIWMEASIKELEVDINPAMEFPSDLEVDESSEGMDLGELI